MATLDGFNPYPIGLTASQSVTGIKNGYQLYDILKNYARVYMSETAPTITDVYNFCEFWYCTVTDKLYRASKNDERNIVVWFEV